MNEQKHAKMLFFCIFCLILTVCIGHNVAQIQAAQPESKQGSTQNVGRENPFAKIPRKKPTPPKVSGSSQSDKASPELFLETVTLKFLDAESLKTIIQSLSSKYGSVSVDNKSNSLILCDTKESLARIKKAIPKEEILEIKEELTTGIYRIVYADIKEVEKTLKAFISETGIIAVNPGTNNILVTDFESRVKAIDNFIKEIDRVTPQVLVEVRIYDITTDVDFDLGIEWNVGRNTPEISIDQSKSRTRTDEADSGTNTYVTTITGSDDPVASAPLITKTVTTIEPPTTGWSIDETDALTKEYETRRRKPFIGGSFNELGLGIGTLRFGLLNDVVDIDIALNILHKQGYAKLLANPRIIVVDNESATFEIVREIPYLEVSETTAGGSMTGYQFKPVGVKLNVTPHITREGMVRLHIAPEFGVEVGSTTPPTVDTRKVNTKALVKDGQTIVLGGLRQSSTTRDTWKVPILGDIPLVGGLFQSETESVKDTELLIFITPRILVETALSPREATLLGETEVPPVKKPNSRLHPTSEKLEPPMLSTPHEREKEDQLERADDEAQDSETITIPVNNVNRTPVLETIGNKSVDENSPLSFSVNASDADGDVIAYSVENLPSEAVFDNQTFTWTPSQSQAGSYQVTFIASDSQLQDSETITITVNSAE